MSGKVGFACKFMHDDQSLKPKLLEEIQRPLNFRTTTRKWCNDNPTKADERLFDLVQHNLSATRRLVEYVASLEPYQRMCRIGSDMLPLYTEPTWKRFYTDQTVRNDIERSLAVTGDIARKHGVRLSFHPGQFTVLASENDNIVESAIEEFEYHVDLARYMGYGKSFQDFKINIHIAGKRGPEGVRAVYNNRLSPEARNTITIENEESKWGLEHTLELADIIPSVLDIHHHWCREGEYIQPTDDRFKRVIDSWRGVQPVIHYSVSREDYLVDHPTDVKPDMESLLASGYKKGKLRAHSDYMWNSAVNEWAGTFRDYADIMVESKCKNLASIPFELSTRK